MNVATAQNPQAAFGVLVDDAALDIMTASAALLAACREPSVADVASGAGLALVHARARACAGTFARLAADVLLKDQALAHDANESVADPEPPGGIQFVTDRELWRMTVLDLAHALQSAHDVRVAIQADPSFVPLGSMLRQLTGTADRLAAVLEVGEPEGADAHKPAMPSMRLPEVETVHDGRANRRRPWFGAGN